jgi:integrase
MPISPHNARDRSFKKIVAAAEIKVSKKNTRPGPFTPHDLRHTMNSLGAAARISEQVLTERSGHTNSTMTRHYTHTYVEQRVDAAESIEAMTR